MDKDFSIHSFTFTKVENFDNAWDISYKGASVGTATNFTDGFMATVKAGDFEKTVSAYHFEGLFDNAMAAYKEVAEKNNTFANFINDWRESLFASFGYTQDDLDAIAEGEAEAEDYLKFQPHGSGPSYSEIEANDRFWGSEAYDF